MLWMGRKIEMKTDQEIEQLARERFKLNFWSVVTPNEKIVLLDAERSFQSELTTAKLEDIKEGMRRACAIPQQSAYCDHTPHATQFGDGFIQGLLEAHKLILSAIDKQTL